MDTRTTSCTEASAIHHPGLVVGEGEDEVMFFTAFLRHLGFRNVQPDQYKGKEKLVRQFIPFWRSRSGHEQLKYLGITRDLDKQQEDSVFRSIQTALDKAGLPVPKSLGVLEPSTEPGIPSVAIFLMPGGGQDGALEDLCLETVKDQPEYVCLQDYFDCTMKTSENQPINTSKAYLRAWLSAHDPDGRLGLAAQHNCFNWDHEAFTPLRNFLQLLTDI